MSYMDTSDNAAYINTLLHVAVVSWLGLTLRWFPFGIRHLLNLLDFKRKLRVVTEYLASVGPLFGAVYTAIVHHHRIILIRARHILLSYGGLLQAIRLSDGKEAALTSGPVEKDECVECEVLYDPGPEKRRVDVIFVHGIKGALTKTWRQGTWARRRAVRLLIQNEKAKEEEENKKLDDIEEASEDMSWTSLSSIDVEEDNSIRQETDVEFSLEESMDQETSKGSKEGTSQCWPRDWLPLDCPWVRVIAVNYTTDPYLWSPFWSETPPRSTLPERSWEMIAKLGRIGVGDRPIVWAGHSKGGLYIKQVLVNAEGSREEGDRDMWHQTKGILFYSVPHRGSRLAYFNILPVILRRSVELTEVQHNCEEMLSLDQKFRDLLEQRSILIKSFVETSSTLMFLLYVRVVPIESALNDFGEMYGVELDHREICKPRGRQCFLYRELVDIIHRCQAGDNET